MVPTLAAVTIIGFLLSPLPGIDAVSIAVTDNTYQVGVDPLDFEILVKKPSEITFTGNINSETIKESGTEITVFVDHGLATAKEAVFRLDGTRISGDSTVIGDLTLVKIAKSPTHTGPYGYFDYGYSYGYGYGYFDRLAPTYYGYSYLGSGDYVYGLSANFFDQDTKVIYTLSIVGSATPSTITIHVSPSDDTTGFFSSGTVPISSGFGTADTIAGGTFDSAGTFAGATFTSAPTFGAGQTWSGSNVFNAGGTFSAAQDFGTSTNTWGGTVVFLAAPTFSAAQTWSGATLTFNQGGTFGGAQNFGTSTGTFAGTTTFSDAVTFGGAMTWQGTPTFNGGGTFSATQTWQAGTTATFGDSASDAFTFSAAQDFSAIMSIFKGALTFTAPPTFKAAQTFDGAVTMTGLTAAQAAAVYTGKNPVFNAAVDFPASMTIPKGVNFNAAFSTAGKAYVFDDGVALPPGITIATGNTVRPGVVFGAAPIIGDTSVLGSGVVLPADAVFTPGQTPPANIVLGSGLVLTPTACPDAACILPAANVLAPGEFFSSAADIAGIKAGIKSSALNTVTTAAIPGLGISLSLTPTAAGSVSVTVKGTNSFSAIAATPAAGGKATFTAGSLSVQTTAPIYEISDDDISPTGSITVTLPYDESNLPAGFAESSVVGFRYTGTVWEQGTGCTVNTATNRVTCTFSGLSPVTTGVGSSITTFTAAASTAATGGGGGGGGAAGGAVSGLAGIPGHTPSRSVPSLPGGIGLSASIENKNFQLSYSMAAGTISSVSVDRATSSAVFTLSNVVAGPMKLSIPRGLVDAPNDKFNVFVTASPEVKVPYKIVDSATGYVTIEVDLPEGATKLRVQGTIVLPGIVYTGVTLYEVSWSLCDSNIVRVVAGPPVEGINVKLRTAKSGVVTAQLVDDKSLPGRAIYEANVDPKETFVFVQVEEIVGRGASTAQKSISFKECSGSVTVTEYKEPKAPMAPEAVPALPTPEAVSNLFAAPKLLDGKTLKTSYDGTDIEISYRFDNVGRITVIDIDEESKSVTFALADVEAGDITLSLPRGVVDAENDEFILSSQGEQIDYIIVESAVDSITIRASLPEGATTLTIMGTSVIPEFGSLAMLVLAAPILILVAMARRLKRLSPQN